MRIQQTIALLLAAAMLVFTAGSARCEGLANTADAITLNDALDNDSLSLFTYGTANWFAQSTTSHDGEDAAQSGVVSGFGMSWLDTSVTGQGQLTFWWKISSEADDVYLYFLVDGNGALDPISGETDWTQVSIEIADGSHGLTWFYLRDNSDSGDNEAAWVDQVVFTACAISLDPTTLAPFDHLGGSATVTVDCNLSLCDWTAVSAVDWVTVTSGAAGPGDGTVVLGVAANSGAARSTTVTVAGQELAISQAAFPVTISPQSQSFGVQGGSGTVQVEMD